MNSWNGRKPACRGSYRRVQDQRACCSPTAPAATTTCRQAPGSASSSLCCSGTKDWISQNLHPPTRLRDFERRRSGIADWATEETTRHILQPLHRAVASAFPAKLPVLNKRVLYVWQSSKCSLWENLSDREILKDENDLCSYITEPLPIHLNGCNWFITAHFLPSEAFFQTSGSNKSFN